VDKSIVQSIAITGLGLRYPGSVSDENSFWQLISNGGNGITDIPDSRWNVDKFYHPNANKLGKMYVKKGGFLTTDINALDTLFFGVSPLEAESMDPQQRLILQVTWEALHNAGIVPESLAGSDTGVFIGAFTSDNLLHQLGPLARDNIGAHTAVGCTPTILSNRISYLLDLKGPSFSVDTACSSSLVALNQACQSIWLGESKLAVVGGVNAIFRPEYFIAMCKGKFLAKDGFCKSFDERADGYARSEGAGAIVLKTLADAERDGDHIHGVIRNIGVNQDGRSNGITSPNIDSQVALIRDVHAKAGVTPSQISFVEAHGTGTQAGDFAECTALGQAIGQHRSVNSPLPIGSVKANIGHLEAASGIAGLIKAILCLKHRKVTPIANLGTANPKIDFENLGIHLPRNIESIGSNEEPLLAAVNSFGYGGTNAHVLLESAPVKSVPKELVQAPVQNYVLPISAKDKQAHKTLLHNYVEFLSQSEMNETAKNNMPSLSDICYSASTRRGHYQHRSVVFANDRQQMLSKLKGLIADDLVEGTALGQSQNEASRPVFVFTGMGPQWWKMGKELLTSNMPFLDAFKKEVQRCDDAFKLVSGWSVINKLAQMDNNVDEENEKPMPTVIAQPANFVIQAGLAALWQDLGVIPSAIIGHSVGEVTAAYVSGVLTLEDAALVSYYRSQIQSEAAGLGGMLAVGLSYKKAKELLMAYPEGSVDIAAINGPESVTLSGESSVLLAIAKDLDKEGFFVRELQVEIAYHSPYMDPLMDKIKSSLASLKPSVAKYPLYSTVSGALVSGELNNVNDNYGAEYWCKNARQAVLFEPAMNSLLKTGHDLFIEIGSHPVLSSSLKQCALANKVDITTIASLTRKKSELDAIQSAIADIYICGAKLNWQLLTPIGSYTELPSYPWQNNNYWIESVHSLNDRFSFDDHPLLGAKNNTPTLSWVNPVSTQCLPYLTDHCVENLQVLPGAAYVEIGLAIHRITQKKMQFVIDELRFFNALVFDEQLDPQLYVSFDEINQRFSILSRNQVSEPWKPHATGHLSSLLPVSAQDIDIQKEITQMHSAFTHEKHYLNMSSRMLQYGPYFQGVQQVWHSNNSNINKVLAHILASEELNEKLFDYHSHPVLLDACFQSLLSIVSTEDKRAFVPVSIGQICFYQPLVKEIYCLSTITSNDNDVLVGDMTLYDINGCVLMTLIDIKAQALNGEQSLTVDLLDSWLYQLEWQDKPINQSILPTKKRWLILGAQASFDIENFEQLNQQFKANEHEIVTVEINDDTFIIGEEKRTISVKNDAYFTALFDVFADVKFDGVVYFQPTTNNDYDPSNTEHALTVLALIQQLAEHTDFLSEQLIYITKNGYYLTDNSTVDLVASAGIGLMRVAINEYPEIVFRHIDTDDSVTAKELVEEVENSSNESDVCLTANTRKVMRLEKKTIVDLNKHYSQTLTLSNSFEVSTIDKSIELLNLPSISDKNASIKETGTCIVSHTTANYATLLRDCDDDIQQFNYGLTTHFNLCRCDDQVAIILANRNLKSEQEYSENNLIILSENKLVTAENLSEYSALIIAQRILEHAKLQPGMTILIHCAEHMIGRALVKIANICKAKIFITTCDGESSFENNVTHVIGEYSYRNIAFRNAVLEATNQQGVDVIVNPFGGEVANHSISLVKNGGRLLQFSPEPIKIKSGIGVDMLNLDEFLMNDLPALQSASDNIMAQLLNCNIQTSVGNVISIAQLKSLTLSDVESGSVSVKLDSSDAGELFIGSSCDISANHTYIVTGGFGGFGIALVTELVNRGAKHLVIVSRSGAKSKEAKHLLDLLAEQQVNVITPQIDIANTTQVSALFLNEMSTMPKLKGIIHTAGILDDKPLREVDAESLKKVMSPKVMGAWNLYQNLTNENKSSLDFFVLFSSIASMIGAAGQSSYVAANVWLDNFAFYCQQKGVPATAISWGALGEVGMAAISPEVSAYFERVGIRPLKPKFAINAFHQILNSHPTHIGIADMEWRLFGDYYPSWKNLPSYHHLMPISNNNTPNNSHWTIEWLTLDDDQQQSQVLERFITLIGNAMKIPVDKIDKTNNLAQLGIDSLIAIDLQAQLVNEFTVRLSMLELMRGKSIAQMANSICELVINSVTNHSELSELETQPVKHVIESEPVLDLDGLSEEQINELLNEFMTESE
jgi:acyl transferase domain-containing protein/NAD(P)-dependent dehydrogenase (short-subunit alcohol dehydrogenase family)/acyl carrier protein